MSGQAWRRGEPSADRQVRQTKSTRKVRGSRSTTGGSGRVLETYRGIPHLLDTWLVLTGMTLPIALSALRRPGDLIPRLAAFCMPAAFALVIAATLSPTAHRLARVGEC